MAETTAFGRSAVVRGLDGGQAIWPQRASRDVVVSAAVATAAIRATEKDLNIVGSSGELVVRSLIIIINRPYIFITYSYLA